MALTFELNSKTNRALERLRHPVHTPIAGKYTKMTEEHADPMVRLIHKGCKSSVLHRTKNKLGVIEIPSMPVVSGYVNRHRPRIPAYMNVFSAMVARIVKRKAMLSTPAGMKAMDDEWDTVQTSGLGSNYG